MFYSKCILLLSVSSAPICVAGEAPIRLVQHREELISDAKYPGDERDADSSSSEQAAEDKVRKKKYDEVAIADPGQLFRLAIPVVDGAGASEERRKGKVLLVHKEVEILGYAAGGGRKIKDEFVSMVGKFRVIAPWQDSLFQDEDYLGKHLRIKGSLYWKDPYFVESADLGEESAGPVQREGLHHGEFILQVKRYEVIENEAD